ncbi:MULTISPECIES: dihydroorotase [Caproicibacterium]|jgi:dihydroorotase|uniref:Dihydroorotase n=1 Tax=Caproicibacterium lactatifermentans TaxID=2666138 RepID=A0A859DSM3_9FIRM|nr:dihydroorotase [Caproicibacterium lactatifermentans]ARP49803.1 dihydroorotase [Ruminococcaceae bacterium CPB6]MDD4807078.1 dihydroorotase [Oscillospiraceae bacterium]QKN24469.1 amidohydrolase family protein [Caproicibacterium lactatifermentans]QKO30518.1 amidohydrolase family protein [Caproicibacterium lactatifermentans]
MKILLKNASLADPERPSPQTGDLLLEHGCIIGAGGHIDVTDAETVDCTGLVAAPGLVDMHVHLRDPGYTEKEDIVTGCRAAAAGGVTTLLCMPNTSPAVDEPDTVAYILRKARNASARVRVAGALTVGLHGKERTDLKALKEAGVTALSDDGRPVENSHLMAEAMKEAADLGLPVVSHCEVPELTADGIMNEGKVSRELDVPGAPAAAEECGIARELALAEALGVPVHICHVSSQHSVELIRAAKKRGVKVTCETAPHYFALTEEALRGKDADLRMSPPLRTEKDRRAVIAGLKDGTIDVIATDHAPHTPYDKGDFFMAPNGVIGMETSLAAGITYLVKPGHLTLNQLLYKMSAAPAKLLRLPYGGLLSGSAADIVLFDPKEHWIVDPEKMHGKSKNAVFKGRNLCGRVKRTYCAGKLVYQDGKNP